MTSHDLLDDLITLAQILSCNSFPFQTLFFPVLYICFLMIQTMWVRHANDGKNECLVKIKKNDYVTVTFRPKSSGAHNLTPYVKKLKPPKREQVKPCTSGGCACHANNAARSLNRASSGNSLTRSKKRPALAGA